MGKIVITELPWALKHKMILKLWQQISLMLRQLINLMIKLFNLVIGLILLHHMNLKIVLLIKILILVML